MQGMYFRMIKLQQKGFRALHKNRMITKFMIQRNVILA